MLEKKVKLEKYIGERKHVSQMTKGEAEYLLKRLKNVEKKGLKWRMTGHTLDRITEKGINVTFEDVISNIHNANVVEYKIDKNKFSGLPEERVVLVSKSLVNKSYRLKVVYSLTERRIMTAWINHVKDNHSTLDWNLYNAKMPVY